MTDRKFDIVVLGSGMAGIPAVQKCLKLGAKTAIVIGRLLGGTCLNVGCIPTKSIWQADHMEKEIEKSRKKFSYSIKKENGKFHDFRSVMEYQAKIVNGLMGLTPDKIKQWGAEVIEGKGALRSKNEVITEDGQILQADKIFIATGSKYKVPKEVEGIHYAVDGDQALKLRELPGRKRIFIIGGGFGGLEYATFFAPFAESIYLSTRKSTLFPHDKDVDTLLQKKMQAQGITVLHKDKVKKIEKAVAEGEASSSNDDQGSNKNKKAQQGDGEGEELHLTHPLTVYHAAFNGDIQKTEVDMVLYMTKRIPNVEGLNLDTIGVEHDKLGIEVNEYLQTSVPNLYAGGDVTDTTKKLTAVGNLDGEYAAINMVKGNTRKREDLNLAIEVMYTEPPIAHVGIMEENAKEKGIKYSKVKIEYNKFPRGIINGNWNEQDGFIKTLFEEDSGKLIGGLVYGEDADNLVHVLMVAMRANMTTYDLGNLPFFHPSLAEGIRYASLHQ
ncbi:MAG: NAD(P)/FAD-dependent oxidoreductase [Thermoproteota archaeon]|nr:NAD(P)/FAD-dependent oxidoreductase [Thermoproteota archaeon]